jgi:hypothetical protein
MYQHFLEDAELQKPVIVHDQMRHMLLFTRSQQEQADRSEKQAHMQSTALLTALQSQPPLSTEHQSPAQQQQQSPPLVPIEAAAALMDAISGVGASSLMDAISCPGADALQSCSCLPSPSTSRRARPRAHKESRDKQPVCHV